MASQAPFRSGTISVCSICHEIVGYMGGAWRTIYRESNGGLRYTKMTCATSIIRHNGDSEDGLLLGPFLDIPRRNPPWPG